jgi:hypothetical protein
MKKIYKIIIALEFICLILLLVGYMDYEDKVAKDDKFLSKNYPENRCGGNFNQTYDLNLSKLQTGEKEGLNS